MKHHRSIMGAALLGATLLALSLTLGKAGAAAERWVLVDTHDLTVSVMEGDTLYKRFDNVAIGSNGATWDKQTRDEKTPLGDFTISEIRPSQRFHVFLGIDYPTMAHAERALREGRLTPDEYQRLQAAWAGGSVPPQNTSLGGHLGIHGLGRGNPEVHQSFNWTDGCVALTNEEVEELAGMLRVGTRVSIR